MERLFFAVVGFESGVRASKANRLPKLIKMVKSVVGLERDNIGCGRDEDAGQNQVHPRYFQPLTVQQTVANGKIS